jgi:hypothetical protein
MVDKDHQEAGCYLLRKLHGIPLPQDQGKGAGRDTAGGRLSGLLASGQLGGGGWNAGSASLKLVDSDTGELLALQMP